MRRLYQDIQFPKQMNEIAVFRELGTIKLLAFKLEDSAMDDPNLKPVELRLLDYFINEQSAGAAIDLRNAAEDIMRTVPLRMAGDTQDYPISEKVRAALSDALSTPGISMAELIRIRKIIRT